MMDFDIKISAAAAIALTGYLLPGAALANLSCPGGTVEMNGQCVVVNNGTTPPGTTNTATGGAGGNSSSDATAGAVGVGVGTGIGVGTGGTATTGPIDVTTGPTTATGGQGGAGGSIGDTTATSGSTSTATGGSSVAGMTGSGNSSSSSTSGVSGSGNSTNSTTVNNTNKTRIKHAASTAAPVMMGGYGPGNCFGDTNPSGQFGASIQTFGWGVTANRSKASNVCAAYAIAGPQGAIGYLAQQDPAFRKIALANGWAVKKSQAAKNAKPAAEPAPVAAPRQRITCPASHPNLRDVRGELRCYR